MPSETFSKTNGWHSVPYNLCFHDDISNVLLACILWDTTVTSANTDCSLDGIHTLTTLSADVNLQPTCAEEKLFVFSRLSGNVSFTEIKSWCKQAGRNRQNKCLMRSGRNEVLQTAPKVCKRLPAFGEQLWPIKAPFARWISLGDSNTTPVHFRRRTRQRKPHWGEFE